MYLSSNGLVSNRSGQDVHRLKNGHPRLLQNGKYTRKPRNGSFDQNRTDQRHTQQEIITNITPPLGSHESTEHQHQQSGPNNPPHPIGIQNIAQLHANTRWQRKLQFCTRKDRCKLWNHKPQENNKCSKQTPHDHHRVAQRCAHIRLHFILMLRHIYQAFKHCRQGTTTFACIYHARIKRRENIRIAPQGT